MGWPRDGHAGTLAFQGCHSSTFYRTSIKAHRRDVWFLAALSWQQERHRSDLVPLPHPPTQQCLCALTATRYPAPRPSLGLRWKQMVCCVQPASTEAEVTPALTGRQSWEAAVMVASPFPGGGSAGSIMLLTRARVCSGVGRGRIWLLRELMHPI